MNRLLGLCLLALLSACATTPTVRTDSDPAASFSGYRTYRWIQAPEGISPLVQQRIAAAVNEQLQAKGWTEASDADVAIAAHVATERRQDIDTFYSAPAYAGWGWRSGWGMGTVSTTSRVYRVGTLVVDLFDARTKRAVWRGSAEGTVPSSQQDVDEQVRMGIAKMFEGFPPAR